MNSTDRRVKALELAVATYGHAVASPRPEVAQVILGGITSLGPKSHLEIVTLLADRYLAYIEQADPPGTDTWAAGVRWAAAEADAQALWREPAAVLDITDHLRACAEDPARGSAVPRDRAPLESCADTGVCASCGQPFAEESCGHAHNRLRSVIRDVIRPPASTDSEKGPDAARTDLCAGDGCARACCE